MAEYSAPHGYWKVQLGALLCIVGLTALYVAWIKVYCWPSAPVTYDQNSRKLRLKGLLFSKRTVWRLLSRNSIMRTIDGNRNLAFLLAVFHLN
uniref:ATP synthase F0 subunit 8 n=1 Tax=Ditylenchus dipsaci TaxID=166011 RepID=A0A915DR57_9BILA